MVVPSRQESFGQTASEAHCCGTPVLAFDVTGLSDIIVHQQTGYLAKAFDPIDLAKGLVWILDDETRLAALGESSRARAVSLWSSKVVAAQYLQVYRNALSVSPE
jgi:glycosyltransferase involved in cell wall biosynthesis